MIRQCLDMYRVDRPVAVRVFPDRARVVEQRSDVVVFAITMNVADVLYVCAGVWMPFTFTASICCPSRAWPSSDRPAPRPNLKVRVIPPHGIGHRKPTLSPTSETLKDSGPGHC